MKPFKPPNQAQINASYAACRHGGVPPAIAAVQLALPPDTAAQLERLFRRRPGGGANAMRPRFARHDPHVAAVKAAGGYPVLPVRRR